MSVNIQYHTLTFCINGMDIVWSYIIIQSKLLSLDLNILLYIVTSSMVGGLSGLLAFCVTDIHRRLNRVYQKHKKYRINTWLQSMCFTDWTEWHEKRKKYLIYTSLQWMCFRQLDIEMRKSEFVWKWHFSKYVNGTRDPLPLHGKCHFKFPFFSNPSHI